MAGAIAVASLVLHLFVAQAFDRLGLFFFNDVLFASDTHDFLSSISHGERSIRTVTPDLINAVHPYVWFYFSPFVRAAARLSVAAGLTDLSVFDARLALGKLVIPAITALQSFVLMILLFLLGLPRIAVAALAVANNLTFSSLLYGSVPDHFAVSNLAITLLMVAALVAYRWPDYNRLSIWIPLGLFATGITSTNIVFLAIAHFFAERASGEYGFWRSARRTALLSGAIFTFVLASADLAAYLVYGPPQSDAVRRDFIAHYMQARLSPASRLARAGQALESSVAPSVSDIRTAPPPPTPTEYYPVTRPPMDAHAIYPAFKFKGDQASAFGRNVLGVLAIAGIVVGAIAMLLRGGRLRLAASMASAIILFNLTLHNFWGDEYVLYSQHWMTPVIVLLAGLFAVAPRLQGTVAGAIAVFAVAAAWNNATVLLRLVESLEAIAAAAGWPG